MLRIAFLLLVLPLAGCFTKPPAEPVMLGMLQPLTGPDRATGEQVRQAVQIALEELRTAEMRIAGRDFQVLHADSGTSIKSARAEAVRLVSLNRVPVLLSALNPVAGETLLREGRLLNVPTLLAGEVPTPPPADGLLALGAGPVARAQATARFVRENLKLGRVAILLDERDVLAGHFAGAFARALRESPAIPCDEIHFSSPETREAALKQITESKAEAVLLALPSEEVEPLRTKLRVPLLEGSTDRAPSAISSDSVPLYRVSVYGGSELTAAGDTFVKTYGKRFNSEPSLPAILSWEAIHNTAQTMQKANASTGLAVREAWTKEPAFEGITGPLQFKDRQAVRKLFAVKEANGKRSVERVFSPGE